MICYDLSSTMSTGDSWVPIFLLQRKFHFLTSFALVCGGSCLSPTWLHIRQQQPSFTYSSTLCLHTSFPFFDLDSFSSSYFRFHKDTADSSRSISFSKDERILNKELKAKCTYTLKRILRMYSILDVLFSQYLYLYVIIVMTENLFQFITIEKHWIN